MVVFDLDGTLVDSTRTLLKAHEAAWRSVGAPCPAPEAILDLVGLPLLDTMRALGPQYDAEELAETYSKTYASLAPTHERLFEGARELLDKPFRAAVATGKSQRGADRVVAQFNLNARFEMVLGGNAVARPKPHPDLLLAIMEETGARNLVMVGDTTYDLQMAQAAGARAIGVSWGHHAVERLRTFGPVANSFAELTALLDV